MELCLEIYPNFEWFRRDYLEISNDDWLATFWMTIYVTVWGPNKLSWTWDTLERYQWSGRNPARSPVIISSAGSLEIPEGRPEPRTQPRRPSIWWRGSPQAAEGIPLFDGPVLEMVLA